MTTLQAKKYNVSSCDCGDACARVRERTRAINEHNKTRDEFIDLCVIHRCPKRGGGRDIWSQDYDGRPLKSPILICHVINTGDVAKNWKSKSNGDDGENR